MESNSKAPLRPTPQQVKNLLSVYRALPARIKVLKAQLGNLHGNDEEIYTRCVSQVNDGMPRPSGPGNKTASIAIDNVTAMESFTQSLQQEQATLELVEQMLKTALGILPELERAIVQEKYVGGKSWTHTIYALGEKFTLQSERTLIRRGELAIEAMVGVMLISQEQYQLVTKPTA